MKIRRYIASNTQEAILKVKMDLGNEALILNTKKVKKKGLLGLFSKPMIEVLAAVDEYAAAKSENDSLRRTDRTSAAMSSTAVKTYHEEKDEKIADLENKVKNIEEILQKLCQQARIGGGKPSEKTASPDVRMRRVMAADVLCNNLIKKEVDPDIAKRIVNATIERIGGNYGMNDIAAKLYTIISGLLGRPETIKPGADGKPTVIMFVGPTGVGKTTTLAKLAANYLLDQKKSIGLITADTYRIAAVEQLRTYAEILGIPITVVYTPEEIKEAINLHQDKDMILIDTAGRSHKNKEQFEELKTLVTAADADEIYLVLSAATSNSNCKEILKSYSFLQNYKLIFTKTDEAPMPGIILNARYLTGKSLSYITTGQSVPDDIEVADIDKITKNLIGSIN
ncbi:MAG: flagellar biosynthesis protein FlhF [Acetivibrionales bacterium]|jgi:flagellar biosynthesis protein FlhF